MVGVGVPWSGLETLAQVKHNTKHKQGKRNGDGCSIPPWHHKKKRREGTEVWWSRLGDQWGYLGEQRALNFVDFYLNSVSGMAPATNECFALAFLCYNLPGGGAVSVEAVEGSLPKVHGFINFQAVSGTARSPVGRKQSWSGLESPGRGWRPLHKSNKTQNTHRKAKW